MGSRIGPAAVMLFSCTLIVCLLSLSVDGSYDGSYQGAGLTEVFSWKQVDYERPGAGGTVDFAFPDTSIQNKGVDENFDFVPYNNVPMGVTHYKGRLFITMPRRRPGIPATLNVINLQSALNIKSPKLTGYPNYTINELPPNFQANPDKLFSVYRTRLDSCNRLWFIDTGMLEYPDNRMQVQQPSIWVMDLETNSVIKRFEIPENIVNDGRGLASITVDVDSKNCNKAFGYIPDLYSYALYVYSFEDDRMWTFNHNYFSFDPLWGDLTIAGQSFQWNDGIFSVTLGKRNPDGFRTAYFHAMCSISEFGVSTRVLRNEANARRSYHGEDFQHLGTRGPWSQSTMHDFDPKTNTIFYAEIAKSGVGCWNTQKPLNEQNIGRIQNDTMRMIYPSDLTIDADGVMWVMTNSMPIFIYSSLDPNVDNFRVWKQDTQMAIKNTVCN